MSYYTNSTDPRILILNYTFHLMPQIQHMTLHVIIDIKLTTIKSEVLLSQNGNLCLSMGNQNRFHILNFNQLIAARLKQKIIEEFNISIKETFMWTDLKVFLHYLQNDRNFGIYESYRVKNILENTEFNDWNYVSSESNITDKTSSYQILEFM